jgi:hypothetical protein
MKIYFKNHILTSKPAIYLWPILAIYLGIVAKFAANEPLGDGIRFWAYAGNLLKGTYATPEVGMLHMGPGYPMLLSVFRGLDIPIIIAISLNAILLFAACVYLYKIISQFLPPKVAIVITYVFAFWDPFLLYWMQKLYSEPLVVFLIVYAIYHLLNYYKTPKTISLFKISAALAYAALTKVIFGYVLLVFLILSAIIYILSKQKVFQKNILVAGLALLFCLPYLGYTYKETGKLFYWGNSGGVLLYWTASPHQTDLGEWHTAGQDMNNFFNERYHLSGIDPALVYEVNEIITDRIYQDHKDFKERLNGLGAYSADALYKQEAIKNIKEHPLNFAKNWIMNIGRITLGYPHALYAKPPFSAFMSLLNIIKSSFLVVFFISSLILGIKLLKQIKPAYWSILLFGVIYFGGTSLLAAQSQRFLIPLTPIIIIWLSSISKHVKLKTYGI